MLVKIKLIYDLFTAANLGSKLCDLDISDNVSKLYVLQILIFEFLVLISILYLLLISILILVLL